MSNFRSSPDNQSEEISIWHCIEKKLNRLPLEDNLPRFRICRVPEHIRRGDPYAYKPQVVSIGPYHHGATGLEAMEDCKWRFVAHIRRWGSRNGRPRLLQECVDKLKMIEKDARECYAGDLTVKIDREHLITATTVVELDSSAKKIEREDLAMRNLTMKNMTVKTERGDHITLGIDRGELLMNTHKFVEMLLLDGCFVIGLLLGQLSRLPLSGPNPFPVPWDLLSDPLFDNRWTKKRVALDVLLLENQLPFVVLESLCTIVAPQINGPPKLQWVAFVFFRYFLPKNLGLEYKAIPQPDVQHLLHFIHMSLSSSGNQNNEIKHSSLPLAFIINLMSNRGKHNEETEPLVEAQPRSPEVPSSSTELLLGGKHCSHQRPSIPNVSHNPSGIDRSPEHEQDHERESYLMMPSVTKLSGAGVKFKRNEDASFLNLTFERGEMKMGQLRIDDHTNRIFRNFIAFEQCLPDLEHRRIFSNYCVFMDWLVNTYRDVEILQDCCIVENLLGSNEEVAALFNKLGDGVSIDPKETQHLRTTIINYTKRKWPKWRAKLVGDYFSNPWATISLVVAIMVFVVGIVQFIYSTVSFYRG